MVYNWMPICCMCCLRWCHSNRLNSGCQRMLRVMLLRGAAPNKTCVFCVTGHTADWRGLLRSVQSGEACSGKQQEHQVTDCEHENCALLLYRVAQMRLMLPFVHGCEFHVVKRTLLWRLNGKHPTTNLACFSTRMCTWWRYFRIHVRAILTRFVWRVACDVPCAVFYVFCSVCNVHVFWILHYQEKRPIP